MKVLLYSFIIVVMFVMGYSFYEDFFAYSCGLLDLGELPIETRSKDQINSGKITLGVICASIPLFHLLVAKAANLNAPIKHLITILSLIVTGLVFWRLRIIGLNAELKTLSESTFKDGILPTIEIQYLKFDIYLLMGFIVGALVAILFFRDRSKPLLN